MLEQFLELRRVTYRALERKFGVDRLLLSSLAVGDTVLSSRRNPIAPDRALIRAGTPVMCGQELEK